MTLSAFVRSIKNICNSIPGMERKEQGDGEVAIVDNLTGLSAAVWFGIGAVGRFSGSISRLSSGSDFRSHANVCIFCAWQIVGWCGFDGICFVIIWYSEVIRLLRRQIVVNGGALMGRHYMNTLSIPLICYLVCGRRTCGMDTSKCIAK